MAALYITEDDVRSVMDMEKSLLITHKVFRELASGRAINIPRQRVRAPGIILHTMSGANEYLEHVGWKAYTTTKENARFHVAIYDQETGEMRALIEGDFSRPTANRSRQWSGNGIYGPSRLKSSRPLRRRPSGTHAVAGHLFDAEYRLRFGLLTQL